MKLKFLIPCVVFLVAAFSAKAQNFALKTNVFYDATATVNLGAEIGLAPRWTLDISGNYNGWKVKDHLWKHAMVQPEARYWFCDRFQGHFLGFHALGGVYNTSLNILKKEPRDERYQGWGVGAGIAYGYAFALGRHFNLELELGGGYIYTQYDLYECEGCGRKVKEDVPYHYVGATKGAINLVYVF
jgi:hypothetical protein